jgi:hypothetical protein
MIDINKFLQLNNPDIARQTRNMSYFDALKSEIPGTKSYQGYNPFYKGADKTGLGGYLKQGIDSVQGKFKPGSNVGGATWLLDYWLRRNNKIRYSSIFDRKKRIS